MLVENSNEKTAIHPEERITQVLAGVHFGKEDRSQG